MTTYVWRPSFLEAVLTDALRRAFGDDLIDVREDRHSSGDPMVWVRVSSPWDQCNRQARPGTYLRSINHDETVSSFVDAYMAAYPCMASTSTAVAAAAIMRGQLA